MKSKYIILASALLISIIAFAQKDQIKAAEKALKGGNPQEAVTILQAAEGVSASAPETEKAQYFFIKGNAHLELANKKVDEDKNLNLAAKAYQDLLVVEKASGKDKYSEQVQTSIASIIEKLLKNAQDKIDKKEFSGAVKDLLAIYDLNKKDLGMLYFAANYSVQAKEYDLSLKLYQELINNNYTGESTNYYAKNIVTDNEDFFGSDDNAKKNRDDKVKIKLYTNPRDEKIPSRSGQIYKNIALILIDQGKTEEAKKALSDARKANTEDNSLLYTEANFYLEIKDYNTYKKIVAEALEKNPNDADLLFNLGVLSANAKNNVEAEKYYKRVIEINPKYVNAYVNLAALKLDDEKPINDEINKLGTSALDMKRYDVLKVKKENLYKSAIPYLKTAFELDPQNTDVAKTLLSVYSALDMTTEQNELKAKIKLIEQK